MTKQFNRFGRIVLDKFAYEYPSSEDFFRIHPWGKQYVEWVVELARQEMQEKIKEIQKGRWANSKALDELSCFLETEQSQRLCDASQKQGFCNEKEGEG